MIKKLEYKYQITIIYIFILFLDRMDLTITNVAMPAFAHHFNIKVTETDWISTSFLIALGIAMPVSGWLSDKFGSKKIFIFANIIFTLSSVLCATAWNLQSLIFFRIIQGIGGGIIVPVGMSMAYRAFPIQQYAKLANYTLIPTLIAPAIAPVIGGIILEKLSWHWIFLLHFPIGIAAIWMSVALLKEEKLVSTPKFDWNGFILLTLFLSTLFYFLSSIGSYGVNNSHSIYSSIASFIFLFLFLTWEQKVKAPLINIEFFKIHLFSQAVILQIALQICYFGSMFLIALYFQTCIGMTPIESGFSMIGQSVGTICMLFFSVKIFNKFGPKYSIIIGLFFLALTTYLLLFIQNPNQMLLANAILYSRGLAIGLVNAPLQACAMFALEKSNTAKGSAIFNVIRQIGISLGVALSCMVLAIQFRGNMGISSTHDIHSYSITAFKFTFLLFSGIAILGAIFSFTINNNKILEKLKAS